MIWFKASISENIENSDNVTYYGIIDEFVVIAILSIYFEFEQKLIKRKYRLYTPKVKWFNSANHLIYDL